MKAFCLLDHSFPGLLYFHDTVVEILNGQTIYYFLWLEPSYFGSKQVYWADNCLDSCRNMHPGCSFRSRQTLSTVASTYSIFHSNRTSCWLFFCTRYNVSGLRDGYPRWTIGTVTDCPGDGTPDTKKNSRLFIEPVYPTSFLNRRNNLRNLLSSMLVLSYLRGISRLLAADKPALVSFSVQ